MRKTQSRIFGRCSNLPGAEKTRQASCVRVHAHFKRGRLVSREGRSADSAAVFCGSAKAQRDVRSSDCRRSPVAAWPRGEAGRCVCAFRRFRCGVLRERQSASRCAARCALERLSAFACRGGGARGETEVARPGALKAALVCANRWFSPAAAVCFDLAVWRSGAMRLCGSPIPRRCFAGRRGAPKRSAMCAQAFVGFRLPRRHGRVAKRGDAPVRVDRRVCAVRRFRCGVLRERQSAARCALERLSAFACRGGMAAWQSGAMRPRAYRRPLHLSRSALICRGGGARRKTRYIIGRNAG